jgi:hypothetical protein
MCAAKSSFGVLSPALEGIHVQQYMSSGVRVELRVKLRDDLHFTCIVGLMMAI